MCRSEKMPSSRAMLPVVALVMAGVTISLHLVAQARVHDDRLACGHVSTQASQRLMRELKDFHNSDSYLNGIFTVDLIDDNIYEWHVKLFIKDQKNPLYWNLQKLKEDGGEDHILLHVKYNENYPFEPPFVRVVYPYLDIVGPTGALCMELLMKDGWNSSYTIEPLILSIAVEKINKSKVVWLKEGESPPPATYEAAKEIFDGFVKYHVQDGKWV